MKHIIIEGGDRLGKNTLVKSILEKYNYNNVAVRHFDKPPKELKGHEALDFQFQVFNKEALLLRHIRGFSKDKYEYHENVVIWNRSHLGEYVYGQMFRGVGKKELLDRIHYYEEVNADVFKDTYVVTLTADPEFFMSQEDGHSFSQTIEEKTIELQLFNEITSMTMIGRKKIVRVDEEGKKKFRHPKFIMADVNRFMNDIQTFKA